MDYSKGNTAVSVRITPVSQRPRLLTIDSCPRDTPFPLAPPSTRSSSPVSEPDFPSDTIPPPPGLHLPHKRYFPIRTHSSPAAVPTLQASQTTTRPQRPRMPRAPATSLAGAPSYEDIYSLYYNLPESEDPWALPPVNASYSAFCAYDPGPALSPSSTSSSRRNGMVISDSRSTSQQSDYFDSQARLTSPAGTPKAAYARERENDPKRKRGSNRSSNARDRGEVTRCGRHGDEWLFEGWGGWFRRVWKE